MLYKPTGMTESFPNLVRLREELEGTDYDKLERKTYESLCKKLDKGALFIKDMTDIYVELEEIVNNLYVVLLTMPYVTHIDGIAEESCQYILAALNQNFLTSSFNEENLIENLEKIEGRQEELGIFIEKQEEVLYDVRERHTSFIDSIMLGKVFWSLYTCQKLLSTSLFIDIYKKEKNEVADRDCIAEVTRELIIEFKELFQGKNKQINRAIMANTMNKMPVFFNNSNEVVEYVMNSLAGCNDEAEKIASINIIRQLME